MNREFNDLVHYFCLYEGGTANDWKKFKSTAEKLGYHEPGAMVEIR